MGMSATSGGTLVVTLETGASTVMCQSTRVLTSSQRGSTEDTSITECSLLSVLLLHVVCACSSVLCLICVYVQEIWQIIRVALSCGCWFSLYILLAIVTYCLQPRVPQSTCSGLQATSLIVHSKIIVSQQPNWGLILTWQAQQNEQAQAWLSQQLLEFQTKGRRKNTITYILK